MNRPTRGQRTAAAMLVRETFLTPEGPRDGESVERCTGCGSEYELKEVRGDRRCGIARIGCQDCERTEIVIADPSGVFTEGGYREEFEDLSGWVAASDS